MKAKVYISNIYWNKGLASFCFREQAYETLEELVNRSSLDGEQTLSVLDELTEDSDLDDVEELFYEKSVEEIAEEYGFELDDNDDE